MNAPAQRVAVIAVHGVADQRPGQTVRELARLLSHGGSGRPRYVEGELHEVIVAVSRLPPLDETAEAAAARAAARAADAPAAIAEMELAPGQPSEFFMAQSRAAPATASPLAGDLGLTLTDYLLGRYQPDERDGLYESTRISLRRQADGTAVDLYELYWADFSRLQPGGVRALSASYQLLFHLSTLARDVVDQAALASGRGGALRWLQRLHAWSAWLLTGPAALLQLAMLLLVVFGAAAFVPPAQHLFLLWLGGGVAAVLLALAAVLAAHRACPGANAAPAAGPSGAAARRARHAVSRAAAALPWAAAAAVCAGIAIAAVIAPEELVSLYLGTAVLLMAAGGVLLVLRYSRAVRGVLAAGLAIVAGAAALLGLSAARSLPHVTSMREWILVSALNAGEYLVAALLSVWAVLAVVQTVALLLSFARGRAAGSDVAASLTTARIGMVMSTALFALLSVVLWSVLAYVVGLALDDLRFVPVVFGDGYYGAANFVEAQVRDVGSLFTPLLALAGVIGIVTLAAMAPSLREELAPGDPLDAQWTARLGRWWTRGRGLLATQFGTVVPALALAGGVIYLAFLAEKLAGLFGILEWLGRRDEVLVTIGKWLAGGAVTVTALGARFAQTFGKLRVALDAVLDIDNYFRDPPDGLPPRARIFSRFAALLDHVRARGYARVVIVAHSQGSVLSADLLRYLQRTARLRTVAGTAPLALVTVGSPLRDLYARRFPLLYQWMGPPPVSFESAAPGADELGLAQWSNAYRSGDYVGRSLWTPPDDAAMFRVATVGADGVVVASRAGDRTEFCLGAGAHTHYYSDTAETLALEIDRLVAGAALHGGR